MKIFNTLKNQGPCISKDSALNIAYRECINRGWPWLEPVDLTNKKGNWIVRTNIQAKGSNVKIVIDQTSGNVIDAVYLSR